MTLCTSPAEGADTYAIGYTDTTSGFRHAYRRVVPGSRIGATEIHLTRSPRHPADPKCPGCKEES